MRPAGLKGPADRRVRGLPSRKPCSQHDVGCTVISAPTPAPASPTDKPARASRGGIYQRRPPTPKEAVSRVRFIRTLKKNGPWVWPLGYYRSTYGRRCSPSDRSTTARGSWHTGRRPRSRGMQGVTPVGQHVQLANRHHGSYPSLTEGGCGRPPRPPRVRSARGCAFSRCTPGSGARTYPRARPAQGCSPYHVHSSGLMIGAEPINSPSAVSIPNRTA